MKFAVRSLVFSTLILSVLLLAKGGWPHAAVATHAMPCPDINGDGTVTFDDADIVLSWWEADLPPVAVPPAAADNVAIFGQIRINDASYVVQHIGEITGCQDTPAHGRPPFGSWGFIPPFGHGPGEGRGDDVMPSLGTFRVLVARPFRALMAGYPGYDGASTRLTSPVLSDSATTVGRSDAHTVGSGADTGGTAVGTAGTSISDSSYSLVPPGFPGTAGSREVHTELRTMNLTGFGAAVRAGTAAPDQPISPGEVVSQSSSGVPANDWPARSFFDVFVEVDLPAFAGFPGGTLYNSDPLLVENQSLERFPPRVVYYHGNTAAVPVLFKTTNPGLWQAGDLFGYLVLAGHGASYDSGSGPEFADAVDAIEQAQGELPQPPLSCADFDGDWICDDVDWDDDSDGCADTREVGSNPMMGGQRSTTNPWDYGDMPNNSGARNGKIRINDVSAVVQRYHQDEPNGTINRFSDPLTTAIPPTGYHPAFDRGGGIGSHPWNVAPPDGRIRISDISYVVQQFHHDCV